MSWTEAWVALLGLALGWLVVTMLLGQRRAPRPPGPPSKSDDPERADKP